MKRGLRSAGKTHFRFYFAYQMRFGYASAEPGMNHGSQHYLLGYMA
jgi:hypothetical protein